MSTAPDASSKSEMKDPKHWRKRPICESIEAQNELTAILVHTYIIQKKYGEPADHVKIRDDAFQKALGRFCIDEVHKAFETYTSQHNDIPAPSDILKILDPPPPVLDRPTYVSIKQKMKWGNVYILPKERNYCARYEQQELNKLEAWEQHAKRVKSAQQEPQQLTYAPGDSDELEDE